MPEISTESTRMQEVRHNPSAFFERPQDVLLANDLTKPEKRAILQQWKIDAMALQQAADENMTGGEPSKIEDVVEALKALDAN